jgi:DNA polymerase elongation subunit (family B)
MVEKEEHLGGMFGNVGLLDVSSMHPSSIVAMNLFGPYTERFDAIRQARIAIKHKDFDRCLDIFRKFVPEERIKDLEPVLKGEDSKALAQALKIAINAVYGLTSASFPTRFNDAANPNNRNLDNKVAKRGALFMIALKHKVQELGYTVVHIKTDSIKIADVDRDILC